MVKISAKKVKQKIKLKSNNYLNMTNKEFFELKRKLFIGKGDDRKKEFSFDDVNKLMLAKIMIDVGFMPQKAAKEINENWNNREILVNELKDLIRKKQQHLEDILTMLGQYQLYFESDINLPITQIDGISQYIKNLSNDLASIINQACEKKINIYNDLKKLLSEALQLMEENVIPNSLKANVYINKLKQILVESFGPKIEKLKMIVPAVIYIPNVRDYLNKIIKDEFGSNTENNDVVSYISNLIIMKYFKDISEDLYAITTKIIDENEIINNDENEIIKKVNDKEKVKDYNNKLVKVLEKYCPIYEIKDVNTILDMIMPNTMVYTLYKDEWKLGEDYLFFIKLINIAKNIHNRKIN